MKGDEKIEKLKINWYEL